MVSFITQRKVQLSNFSFKKKKKLSLILIYPENPAGLRLYTLIALFLLQGTGKWSRKPVFQGVIQKCAVRTALLFSQYRAECLLYVIEQMIEFTKLTSINSCLYVFINIYHLIQSPFPSCILNYPSKIIFLLDGEPTQLQSVRLCNGKVSFCLPENAFI